MIGKGVNEERGRNGLKEAKIYFGEKFKVAGEIWQWCKDANIPSSEFFSQAAMEKFDREKRDPSLIKRNLVKNEEEIKKKSFIERLYELAKEYEEHGMDGADITYKLPRAFNRREIGKEQMAYIILFAQKLKISIDETGNFAEILDEYPIDSKRDIQNKDKMDYFARLINIKLKNENERLKKEQKKKEEDARWEAHIAKKKIEKEEWNKQNPGKPFWMKGLSEDEIETELKIESGEYKVFGINYFPEQEKGEEDLLVDENHTNDSDDTIDFNI